MKYKYIFADPPWEYNGWSTKDGLPNRRAKGRGLATAIYKGGVMNMKRIKQIPVADLCEPNAVLFLWVTLPRLEIAFDVARAWGFPKYSTTAFTWLKTNPTVPEGSIIDPEKDLKAGNGYWTMANMEPVLLFTRGSRPPQRAATGVKQPIIAPVKEHSEKPLESYRRIEKLMGFGKRPGNYLDLFARRYRRGWTALGDELDEMDIFDSIAKLAALDENELGFVPKGVKEPLTDCLAVEDWEMMLRPGQDLITGQLKMAI
jgi:N6-adenosine-specific RNA methylase IME4